MADFSIVGGLIAVITFVISYKAFKEPRFMEENLFEVDAILIHKEYKRLITSGFVHGSWIHLLLNLGVLLSFAPEVEYTFGVLAFTVLYFGSKIAGSGLALYIHRNHGDYRAVGASGAISGVLFAFLVMNPESSISFVLIPVEIKCWIFAVGFIVISIFGIKSQADNIGHEAHLGGAIFGILMTLVMYPYLLSEHPWVIAGILVPSVLFLVLVARNPNVLLINHYWGENIRDIQSSIHRMANPEEKSPEEELDELLHKIREKGINSLSAKERERLDELSRK